MLYSNGNKFWDALKSSLNPIYCHEILVRELFFVHVFQNVWLHQTHTNKW